MSVLTYENHNGLPIVRKCANCQHWQTLDAEGTTGYCKQLHLFFAYSLESTVYGITRKFYYCPTHLLQNEDWLKQEGKETTYDAAYMKRQKESNDPAEKP